MSASVQLNISEPCQQDWQQMNPNNEGRHCDACQKTVIDFSTMTDKEVLAYITNSPHGICGRLAGDQMDKKMAVAEKKTLPLWIYAWNLAVAGFLFGMNVNGQNKSGVKGKTSEQRMRPETLQREIMGKIAFVREKRRATFGFVYDKRTNLPVSGATIQMKGTMYASSADSLGTFSIKGVNGVLRISAIGYKENEQLVEDDGTISVIYLEPEAKELKEVVVVSYSKISCGSFAGGISMRRTETRYTKVKREIDEWLPKNDVKIYPNPVIAGGSVNVKLSLKEPGKYSVEVFSTDGKQVYSQPIIIQTKEYLMSLPVQAAWTRSVYWVRISGGHTKEVYHAKLVVQ